MSETQYRRPLPSDAIAFSSLEGRQVFAEALSAGGLGGYFPLAEQFHTQSDPAFCGLGSLVVALNALGVDPGRLWKGPWRWFAEELLDCCVPLSEVRARGLDIEELACLARCNGAEIGLERADATNLGAFRAAMAIAAQGDAVLVASYDRSVMGQTGRGHFSPIGGYHRERDLTLILDVARFKYPPHWVPVERLWRAMQPIDDATGRPRGWMVLRRREHGLALGFSVRCDGESWQGLARRLGVLLGELTSATDVGSVAQAIVPLVSNLELRIPGAAAHREALERARAALRALPLHGQVSDAIGTGQAEAVTLLLLSIDDILTPDQRAGLGGLTSTPLDNTELSAELSSLRNQFSALWSLAHPSGGHGRRAPTE